MKYRIVKDSFGEMKVDINNSWGAQTQRSLENFVIGTEKMPKEIIYALTSIKIAAALTNAKYKKIDAKVANAIVDAGNLILSGKIDNQFPLKVWQTGSGTQTNMNVNEVLAFHANKKLGKQIVHPNDTVNKAQSSNDVFPSSIHIALCDLANNFFMISLDNIIDTFKQLGKRYAKVIKIGRTHLQDATPILLSQEISGWRATIENCKAQIINSLHSLYELPIGGTAVGTGLNAYKGFDSGVVNLLSKQYKLPFKVMTNKFCGLAFKERVTSFHSQLKVLATSLYKIANDIRFLASGPRCGIGELILPANEPGSSIMPGKVNPTQCEALMMVCAQVIGNDTTITFAASQGNFELNTFMPVIAYDAIWSIKLLTTAIDSFTKKCLVDIKVNEKTIKRHLDNSLMLVTALVPKVGYDSASKIAKYALNNDLTLKQAALKLKLITSSEFDKLIDPKKMI